MTIRRTAALGLTFSVATGALLFVAPPHAEASVVAPQRHCVPWPYLPCPPPPPGHDHDRDRERDRGHDEYAEYQSYEEYLEYSERRRTREREIVPPEVHRVTPTPRQPRAHRDNLPATGAPVLAVALSGVVLVTAGAVVLVGRRRGTRYY